MSISILPRPAAPARQGCCKSYSPASCSQSCSGGSWRSCGGSCRCRSSGGMSCCSMERSRIRCWGCTACQSYYLPASGATILEFLNEFSCVVEGMQWVPGIVFVTVSFPYDFILALSLSEKDLDAAISIIDKFIKRVTFTIGKTTQSIKKQVVTLLNRLNIIN